MAGIGSLLDVSRRALSAQTQGIRTIGANVANVNTPGYSRQQAEFVSQAPSLLGISNAAGSGVEVTRIIRRVDEFLNKEYLVRLNDSSKNRVRDEVLQRAQAPFTLEGTAGRIGYQLSEFFSSLEDLAVNPSDIPLRDRVIETGQALTQSIRSAFALLKDLQRETDTRIGVQISEVNRLSAEIAALNTQIAGSEIQEQENLALRDQRDELVRSLSKLISVETIAHDDGTMTVTLENGFALVIGDASQDLDFVQTPSFEPVGGYPSGLDGAGLGLITYNFGDEVTRSDINLTNVIAAGGGELSGLLSLRGIQSDTDTSPYHAVGDIVDVAARVESIARDLLTRFNLGYLGSDETAGGVHNPSSGDLDGNTPGVYGLFSATGATDLDADGTPDDLLNNVSFADDIAFAVTNARDIAAALDLDATAGSLSFAPGDGSNIANLVALRGQTTSYSIGNFTATSTIEDLYQTTVSKVGGLANTAKSDNQVSEARETQVRELVASVSGVSLDEEFASLIGFQRAFEAAARMIRTSDELFNEVLQLLG